MRFAFFIAAAVALLQLAAAGTVTLTGTCPNALSLSSNYIFFNISNSGTDPALNMLITPNFTGFSTYNSFETINVLGPTQMITKDFYIYNLSYPGTYIEAFLAKYDQGSSTFYAVFPCPVSIGNGTVPKAVISSITGVSSGTLKVNVSNTGNRTISAIISVVAPPTLSLSPASAAVLLQPGSEQSLSFSFVQPPSGQSFTTAFALSYTEDGQHFASIMDYIVENGNSAPSPQQGGSTDSIVIDGFVALIAFILILITLSLRRSAKRVKASGNTEGSHTEAGGEQKQG